jgi:hypothetical protein
MYVTFVVLAANLFVRILPSLDVFGLVGATALCNTLEPDTAATPDHKGLEIVWAIGAA